MIYLKIDRTRMKGDDMARYIVVFMSPGIQPSFSYSAFNSKEDFQKWYTTDIQKTSRVFKEGVTITEAIRLCEQDAPAPSTSTLPLDDDKKLALQQSRDGYFSGLRTTIALMRL